MNLKHWNQRLSDVARPGFSFRPIFKRYQETLVASGEIDFHDMINRATELVETGRYRSPFGYILVDEFQDISPSPGHAC